MNRPARLLIVNGDDFGQSPGVNAGIIQAHERGCVSSASLMVRWPAAPDAAARAKAHPALSVGLHLDLSEWTFGWQGWTPLYEVVPESDPDAVEGEVRRQLAAFRSMLDREPTHLDSHQHVHRSGAPRDALLRLGVELGVPVRGCSELLAYRGDFYGQTETGSPRPEAITVEALVRFLSDLPAGVTEMGCHPAAGDDLRTMYAMERTVELATLCSPEVRSAIVREGIELISYAELPGSALLPGR